MVKRIVILITLIMCIGVNSFADKTEKKDIFSDFADDAVSYFAPVSGTVTGVKGDIAEIGIGRSEGIRKGMRLKVFREGEEFRHPVTGEFLGKIESESGSVEVVDVEEKESSVKVLSGDIKAGDRVRISSGTLPIFFYQTRSVDWAVGDALYRKFKDTGRFQIVETGVDKDDVGVMLNEAEKHKVVYCVFVEQRKIEGHEMLEVSLYYPDGTRFYKRARRISDEKMKELKFGYSFLKKVETSFQLSYEVPSSTDFISSCDLNGDGSRELVMAIDTDIEVFKFGVTLKLLYFRNTGRLNEIVALGCQDIDNDGKAEIVVTSVVESGGGDVADDSTSGVNVSRVSDNSVVSEVFGLKNGALITKYTTAGFMRAVKQKLYYQAFSRNEGYSGDVYIMNKGDKWEKGEALKLPAGVNIYDFMPFRVKDSDYYLVVDDSGYIDIFNSEGLRTWRRKEKLGGFLREYTIPGQAITMQSTKWYVKDRIVPYHGRFLVINRNPVARNAMGLGFSSGEILGLAVNGLSVNEKKILKDIGGTLLDFTVMDDRIAVLVRPFLGIKMGNILKGENPFKRNLYVFSLQ
ncbi:MAG TPA: VCBS repeat-containing protein [Nitrospirae bacterium]|nr:VCBS repeat-containing protein [Nitrospirota bacterium]HDZ89015.1 VCBS repeat-containing protein [Nitrospirota bacterium]